MPMWPGRQIRSCKHAPSARLHSGTHADTCANTPCTRRHTRHSATRTGVCATQARSSRRPQDPHMLGRTCRDMRRHTLQPHTPPYAQPGTNPDADAHVALRSARGQARRGRPAWLGTGPETTGCQAGDGRRLPGMPGAGQAVGPPLTAWRRAWGSLGHVCGCLRAGSGLQGRRTRLRNGHRLPRCRSQARWPSGRPHRSARLSPCEPVRPSAPARPLCPLPEQAAQPGSVPSSRCLL